MLLFPVLDQFLRVLELLMACPALGAVVFDQLVDFFSVLYQTALRFKDSLAYLTYKPPVHVSMCCQSHFCCKGFVAFLTFDRWQWFPLRRVRLTMNR